MSFLPSPIGSESDLQAYEDYISKENKAEIDRFIGKRAKICSSFSDRIFYNFGIVESEDSEYIVIKNGSKKIYCRKSDIKFISVCN